MRCVKGKTSERWTWIHCFCTVQELPSLAQRPTWPLRWREGINSAPRRMCGAAAACCCTCSMAATHGSVTIPIHCVSRWVKVWMWFSSWGGESVSISYISWLVWQIVNEPPPLWEVPSHCNHFTSEVFKAGLQKDPDRRASAKELRRKTTKALRAGPQVTTIALHHQIILYWSKYSVSKVPSLDKNKTAKSNNTDWTLSKCYYHLKYQSVVLHVNFHQTSTSINGKQNDALPSK